MRSRRYYARTRRAWHPNLQHRSKGKQFVAHFSANGKSQKCCPNARRQLVRLRHSEFRRRHCGTYCSSKGSPTKPGTAYKERRRYKHVEQSLFVASLFGDLERSRSVRRAAFVKWGRHFLRPVRFGDGSVANFLGCPTLAARNS